MARAVSGWQRRSAKTLTKLLATCPRHVLHREQILEILWPGADAESALNSLGKAVHAARHAFEPELPRRQNSAYLRLTDAMLALDAEHVVIDADQFERLAEDSLRRRDASAYESALVAYGGVLLPEDRYADWCAERRGYLSELHIRVLVGLAERLEARGAYNDSADRLRQALREDQTREDIHRRLMLLYAEMGTSDQAVRQFHLCEDVLRRELNLAPQHETVCLYQDVLAGRAPRRQPASGRAPGPVSPHQKLTAEARLDRPFIGRERVLQRLCQLTRDHEAAAGLILISGEAGVGKTRLLQELAARASRQGATVLWGGSGAHAHHFLRGPFAVALEGYAASRPEAERNELALRYPSLASFVPSLGAKRQLPAQVCDPRNYHLDLIPDIVRLLTDLARRQPVLLIVGDLGEADPVSLDLVRYLAQLAAQRPWLMVGAVRKEDMDAGTEVWRMMYAAMRERLCLEIELRCLSRRDCDQLVRAMLAGSDVGDELTEQIYLWSGGNPLFIGALVQELRDGRDPAAAPGQRRDPLEPSGVTAVVPGRVRALTATRLAGMDQNLRRVLGLAAVALPAEISLRELRRRAAALEPPVSDAALGEALDRALLTGILEERQGGYAFRHPLVRSALCAILARHRREELLAVLAAGEAADPVLPRRRSAGAAGIERKKAGIRLSHACRQDARAGLFAPAGSWRPGEPPAAGKRAGAGGLGAARPAGARGDRARGLGRGRDID